MMTFTIYSVDTDYLKFVTSTVGSSMKIRIYFHLYSSLAFSYWNHDVRLSFWGITFKNFRQDLVKFVTADLTSLMDIIGFVGNLLYDAIFFGYQLSTRTFTQTSCCFKFLASIVSRLSCRGWFSEKNSSHTNYIIHFPRFKRRKCLLNSHTIWCPD